MTIPERITYICKIFGVTASQVEKDCGFSHGYITRAKNPTIDSVVKIAEYFNISIEDLCGVNTTKKATADDAEAHGELIALYNGLDEKDREMCLDLIRTVFKHKGVK